MQDVLRHKDVQTVLNIYRDVIKELKRQEFDELNKTLGNRLKVGAQVDLPENTD